MLQPARLQQRQDPSSRLNHPGKTSPTGLISHGFSYLSHREHLNSAAVAISRVFCSAGPSAQIPTALQGSAQRRAAHGQSGSRPQGPPRGFAGKFPDFSRWKGLGGSRACVSMGAPAPAGARRCVRAGVSMGCRCGCPSRAPAGVRALQTGNAARSPAQLSKAAAFVHRTKRGNPAPFWLCKEQPGAQPGVPREVTALLCPGSRALGRGSVAGMPCQ